MKKLLLILILLLMSSFAYGTVSDNLIAYYKFDGNTSSEITEFGQFDITLNVGAGGAWGFAENPWKSGRDGNEYIWMETPGSARGFNRMETDIKNFTGENNATVGCWINVTSTITDEPVFGNGNISGQFDFFMSVEPSNKIRFNINGGFNDSTNLVTDGEEYCMVVTFNAGLKELYVDGDLWNQITDSNTDGGALLIGQRSWLQDEMNVDGELLFDECAVWSRELNNSEITDYCNLNGTFPFEAEAPPAAPEEEFLVNITSPLNGSSVMDDPLNINYTTEFNFTECKLYNNVSGSMELIDSFFNTTFSAPQEGLVGYYDFEEGSGTLIEDQVGGRNGTLTGGNFAPSKGTNETGDFSVILSGDGDETEFVTIPDDETQEIQNGTIALWAFVNESGTNMHVASKFDSTLKTGFVMFRHASNVIRFQAGDGISWPSLHIIGVTTLTSGWHHIAVTLNSTNATLFINGVQDAQVPSTLISHNDHEVMIGGDTTNGTWKGKLDELALFSISLSQSEIQTIYNNGIGGGDSINITLLAGNFTFVHDLPSDTQTDLEYFINCTHENSTLIESNHIFITYDNDVDPPVITLINPTNNTVVNNNNVDINFSTDELTTCIINNSIWTNVTDNQTFYHYTETTANDSIYHINISCIDVDFPLISSFIIVHFEKDTTSPIQTWTNPLSSNSTEFVFNTSNSLTATFTDNNLFAYEVIVLDETSTQQYNFSATDLLVNSFNFSETIMPSSLGTWTLISTIADSHTKALINDYPQTITEKKLLFEFTDYRDYKEINDNVTIEYIGSHTLENITTEKLIDRYNFNFEFDLQEVAKGQKYVEHKFQLTCKDLYVIKNSEYDAHFVCWETRKWVDFESDAVQESFIAKCGEDCYNIILRTTPADDLLFSSIGGLNEVTETIEFTVTEEPPSFSDFLIRLDCPDTVADVLMFVFIFLVIVIMYIVAKTLIRYPIITLLSLIGGAIYFIAFMSCNTVIATIGLIIIASLMLLEAVGLD